jgi:uncharacterized protein YbjT (DUF2867 family)
VGRSSGKANMKVALVAGSSGLIGKHVLQLLVGSPAYSKVIALTRAPLEINNEKLKNIVAEFDTLNLVKPDLRADDVFCCLGTTMKKAGSKEAFRKVDYNYPLKLATMANEFCAKQFLIVTALGANKKSGIFYNQVKGEVEEAIGELPFESFLIFRPSLLMGDRKEKRFGEEVGKVLTTYLGWMLPKKYRVIDGAKVARAMVNIASEGNKGKHIYESDVLQNF